MTSLASYPTRVPRTRGPIVAIVGGRTGLTYRCGHFVPTSIEPRPGVLVKDAIDASAPCPICWPAGARFHAQTIALATLTPQVPK